MLSRLITLIGQSEAPRYMTIDECAAYSRLSVDHIYHLASEGKLRCAKLGKRVIFDREDVDRWIARRKTKTNDMRDKEAGTYIQTRKIR